MKTLLIAAALLFATSTMAQQQGQPPYAPPPHETPAPPVAPGEQNPNQMPPDANAGQLPPSDAQTPAAESLSPAEVQQQIQQKISDEPMLAGNNVSVSVDDRSVTLQGTVDSQKQHDVAMHVAQSLAGSRPVVDKLQIREKS